MNTRSERMRALTIVGAFVASVCACKDRAGSEPCGAPERPGAAVAGTATSGAAGAPAIWEAIDEGFKGCEGG